ncbi:MAG: VacJ family lipoprotein [Deltaproteobacteria bacterium]|nr:VacJ family lipoprotein [Deltaproteobacteria bacterium]
MKSYSIPLLLLVFLTLGCAHGSHPASSPAPATSLQLGPIAAGANTEDILPNSPDILAQSGNGSPGSTINPDNPGTAIKEEIATTSDQRPSSGIPGTSATSNNTTTENDGNLDFVEEGAEEEKAGIADPLEPFNRAMYHFNDKLYFWVLKPVAQGYQKVVPESARVSVSNFFSNLAFPVRFVNCLLQGNFSGASTEFGRFLVNTVWGVGGFLDPASSKDIELSKQDEDLGQTLGVYGLGQGFFINWPILGPSSPRDTVGLVGDFFLHPFTYLTPAWETTVGIRGYEKVNATSLSIGDYESLKEAAIDPYVAIRDAYVQYRLKKINAGKIKPLPVSTGEPSSVPESEKAP